MTPLPNIREIAEKAGVSVATVSRVINRNGRYSRETGDRVRQVIAESGYLPNLAAKGLRTSRTQSIGVVVPNILNAYYAKLVFELQNALFEHQYSTIICNTNESPDLEKQLVATLLAHQVSGIVFISGRSAPAGLQTLPVVFLDRRPKQDLLSPLCAIIESDNRNGGRLAARELLTCGCHFLAAVYTRNPDVNQKQRLKGFHQALAEFNTDKIRSTDIVFDDGSAASIRRYLPDFLRSNPGIDGLFCLTDMVALGLLGALQQNDLQVPADICLIGFDDSPLADLWLPSLSTIRQDASTMARLAAGSLLSMISGLPPQQLHSVVPVDLIRRATTKILNNGLNDMDKCVAIGLDVGGTNIRIGAQAQDHEIIAFEKVSRADVITRDDAGAALAVFVAEYLKRHNLTGKVGALVAGFPSTVSRDRRTILQTPNIPAMDNIPMADILEQHLMVPVFLERDVNLIYEHDRMQLKLSAEGIGIGIYFGTGIGNAIFIDGQPLVGRDGCAGEIGHIPMIGREDICGCGNPGCTECYASGTRLVAIQKAFFPDTPIIDIFVRHRDEAMISEFIDAMACVVAAEVNILNPEHVVLGGGLLSMSDFPRTLLEERIRIHLRKPYPAGSIQILYASEAQKGGVLGALSIARAMINQNTEE